METFQFHVSSFDLLSEEEYRDLLMSDRQTQIVWLLSRRRSRYDMVWHIALHTEGDGSAFGILCGQVPVPNGSLERMQVYADVPLDHERCANCENIALVGTMKGES